MRTAWRDSRVNRRRSRRAVHRAQADAGRTAYQANCASCHNADLSGSGNAAPLAGSVFMGGWGNRTTQDLVGFMAGRDASQQSRAA